MNSWHCQGCRGSTRDGAARCPGLPVPEDADGPGIPEEIELTLHHHLRHLRDLPWRVRLKILAGRPVCVDIDYRAGLVPDVPGTSRTDPDTAPPDTSDLDRFRGPGDLLGPDGPWKDMT